MQDQVDYMLHRDGEIYRRYVKGGVNEEANLGPSDVPFGTQVRSADRLAGCEYAAHAGHIPLSKLA